MSTFEPCGSRTIDGHEIIKRLAIELGVDETQLTKALTNLATTDKL